MSGLCIPTHQLQASTPARSASKPASPVYLLFNDLCSLLRENSC